MVRKLTKTEEGLNNLFWACQSDLGSLAYTYTYADLSSIGQFRVRDLFTLRQTSQHLPNISEVDAVGSLITLATHMNTYEGTKACLALIGEQFKAAADQISRVKIHVDNNWQAMWENRFGMSPVRPEEYSLQANIPDCRPIPKPQTTQEHY